MPDPLPRKILFAGSGAFGVPTLSAILQAGGEVAKVITQPDRPAGRGRKLTPTPIGQFALDGGLELIKTSDINGESLPSADVMVVIAFGQKIGPAAVDRPTLGSVNLHASRLPKYRGAAPINWAILRGATFTGNSVIRLAQRMDAGAILGQSTVPIGELETAGELHDRLAIDGADLVLKVLRELAAGRAVETPQDESQATQAPKLARQSTALDWTRPAVELARQIRGLYPWPGCRVEINGQRFTLVRARAVEGGGEAGCIDAEGHIGCGAGRLAIVELQPEGGRAMPLEAYRRGHALPAGACLQSVVA